MQSRRSPLDLERQVAGSRDFQLGKPRAFMQSIGGFPANVRKCDGVGQGVPENRARLTAPFARPMQATIDETHYRRRPMQSHRFVLALGAALLTSMLMAPHALAQAFPS